MDAKQVEFNAASAYVSVYKAALAVDVFLRESLRVTGTHVRIYPEGALALGFSANLIELTPEEAFSLAQTIRDEGKAFLEAGEAQKRRRNGTAKPSFGAPDRGHC